MTLTSENDTEAARLASLATTSPNLDPATHLTVRLARLGACLEEAIFERDLAQRVQARLEKEYRAQAQNKGQDTDLSRDLDFMRQEKRRLESEGARQRQAQSQLEQELQLSYQNFAALQAQVQTILNSSGWHLVQSLRRLIGRAW